MLGTLGENQNDILQRPIKGTHQKALSINLNPKKYGSFAEIGAGQEVVRWFFLVGGASGTVARSISAYDMTVSDYQYGTAPRYVSRERLENMLEHEWKVLQEQLYTKRGKDTEFFVFANTVAARSYKGTHECHGWMGVRYQSTPDSEPNQTVMHVRMLDWDAVAQQEALGILGVNLLYAALNGGYSSPEAALHSLLDDLSPERLEVDMVHLSGPSARGIDHRLLSLHLVQMQLSDAAMFSATGEVLQPSEALYKRPVLIERGSFRPVTHVNVDMMQSALSSFRQECRERGDAEEAEPLVLAELTMNKLEPSSAHPIPGTETASSDGSLQAPYAVNYQDFLARADLLAASGMTVLISDFFEYYRLATYIGRLTNRGVRLVMGVPSVREIMKESYYEGLEGGILESLGRLFKNDLKLYVYPLLENGNIVTADTMTPAQNLRHLYQHLLDNQRVVSLPDYRRDYLPIFSREVLARIAAGDASWEEMVPGTVAEKIKDCGYFGCRPRE
jgi:hypothetical protein